MTSPLRTALLWIRQAIKPMLETPLDSNRGDRAMERRLLLDIDGCAHQALAEHEGEDFLASIGAPSTRETPFKKAVALLREVCDDTTAVTPDWHSRVRNLIEMQLPPDFAGDFATLDPSELRNPIGRDPL